MQTSVFVADWKQAGLTDELLRTLENRITENPDCGNVVSGTGGLRKVRMAPVGRGKSGGYRICYAVFPMFSTVYLISLFSKNEQDNLTPAEKKSARIMLGIIAEYLRKGHHHED